MDSERIKETIRKNAAEIVRLHSRVHETVRNRNESAKKRLEWEQACAEFHRRYSNLAFPGGYAGARERITSGEPNTMEAAICFLECRPYFFRSGYMFKDILRWSRRAPLSPQQATRLKAIAVIGRLHSNLTPWAPAVDIYETENELVVKADLPDVNPQDLDIRVENNILTIRGERKFDKEVHDDNYLRIERAYGSFSRSFSLANSVNSDAIKADYHDGVLTLSIPKTEEAKPKQIKVNVRTLPLSQSVPQQKSMAAVAGAR